MLEPIFVYHLKSFSGKKQTKKKQLDDNIDKWKTH